jgi:hypothetical protein
VYVNHRPAVEVDEEFIADQLQLALNNSGPSEMALRSELVNLLQHFGNEDKKG